MRINVIRFRDSYNRISIGNLRFSDTISRNQNLVITYLNILIPINCSKSRIRDYFSQTFQFWTSWSCRKFDIIYIHCSIYTRRHKYNHSHTNICQISNKRIKCQIIPFIIFLNFNIFPQRYSLRHICRIGS